MDRNWAMIQSFFIDLDHYSDRDREMFVCGVEFYQVYLELLTGEAIDRPIKSENTSRIRMMLGKMCRSYVITNDNTEWARLQVGPSLKEGKE